MAHLVHRNRGAVGRKWHFAEPLRANEQKPEREKRRSSGSENQPLRPPGLVALRSRGSRISKSQPCEDENPPAEFHTVKRHIHHRVEDRRQRCGDQPPSQRPGGRAPERQQVADQDNEQRECTSEEQQPGLARSHEPVALGMNGNRLVDAGIDIERGDIAKGAKPGAGDRVVPDDFYGVAKNLGAEIREGHARPLLGRFGNQR